MCSHPLPKKNNKIFCLRKILLLTTQSSPIWNPETSDMCDGPPALGSAAMKMTGGAASWIHRGRSNHRCTSSLCNAGLWLLMTIPPNSRMASSGLLSYKARNLRILACDSQCDGLRMCVHLICCARSGNRWHALQIWKQSTCWKNSEPSVGFFSCSSCEK